METTKNYCLVSSYGVVYQLTTVLSTLVAFIVLSSCNIIQAIRYLVFAGR